MHHSLHLQSEDDCIGHETARYTFFIAGREVGNMTADMPGLRLLSKSGDVAEVTLNVPTHHVSSSLFNLTVVLSNTVEFIETITSSSNGVNSTLKSNTWYTTSEPYYCESEFDPHGTVCSCSTFWQYICHMYVYPLNVHNWLYSLQTINLCDLHNAYMYNRAYPFSIWSVHNLLCLQECCD